MDSTTDVEIIRAGSTGSDGSRLQGNTNPGARITASKYWVFTYNNYDLSYVEEMYCNSKIARFAAQEEVGENGTPHIQGCLELTAKGRPLEVFKTKNVHWEKMKGRFEQAVDYCTKDETKKEGGKVWLKGCVRTEPIRLIEPMGWQLELVKRIPEMIPRKIYWYWDAYGNKGKSKLLKYLVVKENALCLSGKAADMKFGVMNLVQKGTPPRLVLIDVPRACEGYISYTGIEEVSNGCFFSSKYESGMCVFNDPIVIVFANIPPDTAKMSKDRWDITDITLIDVEW